MLNFCTCDVSWQQHRTLPLVLSFSKAGCSTVLHDHSAKSPSEHPPCLQVNWGQPSNGACIDGYGIQVFNAVLNNKVYDSGVVPSIRNAKVNGLRPLTFYRIEVSSKESGMPGGLYCWRACCSMLPLGAAAAAVKGGVRFWHQLPAIASFAPAHDAGNCPIQSLWQQ